MSRFLNPKIAAIKSYTPGEQPRDKRYIKLNTNESPYPPSGKVIRTISEERIKDLRLYCDPTAKLLKEAMARAYGTEPSRVFLSNGSDDILNFAFMAYAGEGAAYPDITYGFYSVFAALHGVAAEVIPLLPDFTVGLHRYRDRRGLVVIANPNAPTGIYEPLSEIEELVRNNPLAVVLVDEAYIDFGGESAVSLTEKYDNLLVVGTFSKSRSMAGARLGFAIGNESLISDLEKIKYSTNPYNINSLTQAAGCATLEDGEYYRERCRMIMAAREYARDALAHLGFTVLPSEANFIFAKSDRIGGRELYLALKERGILVRHFDAPRIADFNRITIGTMEEMRTLVSSVEEILKENEG